MLKRKPKFFLRLLPTEEVDWDNIKIESNREIIHVRCLQDLYFGNKDSKPRFWSFQTDGIFYNDTQEDVYTTVMSGVIESIYEGVSTVIPACGQTCSGKSFTMGAFRSSYEFRGIVPRFINAAFSDKETKTKEWKVKVSMSFVDILGNSVLDLKATPTKLTEIKNVSMTEVSTEEEALDFVFTGEGQRRTSEMAPFIGSHCNNGIITFYFECLSLTRSNAVINRAKVHFVDLAGVETVGKRHCTSYKSASDQGAANLAKSDLEHVLLNIFKTDEYRSSGPLKRRCKLIEYLGRDFDPGCNIRFIGHIRPTFADLEVTLSTLKFGLRVKNIPAAPLVYYTEPNIDLVYQNIKEELNQLKEQMLVEQLLSGTREVQSDNFSQARLEHLNRLASAYLNGWSSEVNVLGNTENIITLKIFRKLFTQKAEEVEMFLKERLSTDVSRTSRSSKQLRKSKDEIIEPPASKSQKQGKLSFRDLTKRRLSSKMSAKPQGSLSAAQSQLPVPSELPLSSDIDTKQSISNLYQDIMIPELSENKIWCDFLIEQNIQSTILDELADTVRTKKKIYESAADEYNEVKVNLGRNRLALKEIAWKRQSGKNELYDRFGQIHISHEEKLTAQLVSSLEDSEKNALKLMEKHFNEWKVAANEFLQEKLGLEEKFKEYCKMKYNIPLIPPTDEPYNNNLENEIPRDVLKVDKRKRHFNHLAKNLIRRGRAECAKCSDG